MKKQISLLILLAFVLGMLAGCAGGTSSNSQERPVQAEAQAGPAESLNPADVEGAAYKSEIRIGISTDLTSACKYTSTATTTAQTCNSTFEGLVTIDEQGNASPRLAIDWDNNDDSSEWTFTLRQDVKFHDGSGFTAEDVKFTWDYASDTNNEGVAQALSGGDIVSEVIVEDTYTVTFKLNNSCSEWLNYAAQDILCKASVEKLGLEKGGEIGTGPFYFDKVDTGVSWTITRFEDYWGEKPKSEAITFVVIQDASARALALKSGDIDAMYDGNNSDIVNFMADSDYNVFEEEGLSVVMAGFNADSELGANPIVRQAVAMSVSRDELLIACYENGACGTAAYNIINPGAVGYTDVDCYEYDPEGAKMLLEENGLANITLELYTFGKYIPVAEIMQANLAAAGITLNITEWAQNGFSTAIREDNGYDLAINVTQKYGGVISVISEFLRTGTSRSHMKYSDPTLDALIEQGMSSPTYEGLLEAFAEMQHLVAKDVPWIPLVAPKQFCIGSSNFYGVRLNAQPIDINFSGCYVIE